MIFLRLLLIAACCFSLWPSAWATDNDLNLNDYRGQVLYVDFWASWCGPCRESFPWMNRMLNQYQKDGLIIVAVNLDKDKADAQDFLKKVPAHFSILYNPSGSLAEKYQVMGMPTALIFDRQGHWVHQHIGFNAQRITQYEQAIQSALRTEIKP